ncbi:MAG: Gfo/Idh/MocA family protein [Pirellulaceae bacterium]
MVRVGIAGVGFMGWIHWLAWQKLEDVEVVAICSRDPAKRAGDWTSIQGNFGPPGQQVDLSGIRTCEDYADLVADDSIDLIDICLPPNMHCQPAIDALDAGRHVLCEKPMALSTGQCDQMLAAASRAGRQLLVGHSLPFFSEFAFVRDLAESGQYGKLQGGEFKRTVADPAWLDGFFDPEKIGGPLLDLLVHDVHFIRALFGMPAAVSSRGRMRGDCVEYCATIYDFEDDELVVASFGGVINQQGRPFTHAFEVRFEHATVQFEFAAFADETEMMPLKILTADGQVIRPVVGDDDPADAFVPELAEVARVVSGAQATSSMLDGGLARDAVELCHAQTQSVRSGRKVSL